MSPLNTNQLQQLLGLQQHNPYASLQQLAAHQHFNTAMCATTCSAGIGGGMFATQIFPDDKPVPIDPFSSKPKPSEKGNKSVFTEITKDVKSFILEYRFVLYALVVALAVDHFVFRGAFRERLQSIVDKIVAKIEAKVS